MDIALERSAMTDFWNFRKKYHEVKDDDEYWTGVIQDSDALVRKYDYNDYLKALIFVCVDDLERRHRQEFIGKNPNIKFVPGEIATTVYNRIMKNHKEERVS